MNKVQFSYVIKQQPRAIIYYDMDCKEFESFMNSKKDTIKYIHIEKMICDNNEYANKLINMARSFKGVSY